MRSLTSSRPVWSASRVARGDGDVEDVVGALGPGQLQDGVEPALDPAPLHALLGHALEAAQLLAQGGDHVAADPGGLQGVDALPVALGHVAVVGAVAQLLADGLHLAPQQHLPLLAVEALPHVGGDLLGQLPLGQGLLDPAQHQGHPGLDVDGLQQLDLLGVGQVRPPAGQVGQRAGVVGGDAGQRGGQTPTAHPLEQGAQRGPQLAPEAEGLLRGGAGLDRDGLDPQPRGGTGDAGRHPGPARGPDHGGHGAAGQGAGGLDAGHRAHLGQAPVDPGHEQQLAPVGGLEGGLGLVGLEGDGDHHRGQHHALGQGQHGEGAGVEGAGHGTPPRVTCEVQATTYGRSG